MAPSYWILRAGIGFVYLYSGWGLFFHPDNWSFFVPAWMMNFLETIGISLNTYLQFQGSVEFLMGVALLAWFMRGSLIAFVAAMTALEMAAILLFYGVDVITFRDIAILAAALALFFQTPEGERFLPKEKC